MRWWSEAYFLNPRVLMTQTCRTGSTGSNALNFEQVQAVRIDTVFFRVFDDPSDLFDGAEEDFPRLRDIFTRDRHH